MSELLPERLFPCPFCGSEARKLRIAGRAAVRVRSLSCDGEGPVAAGFARFDEVYGRIPADAGEGDVYDPSTGAVVKAGGAA